MNARPELDGFRKLLRDPGPSASQSRRIAYNVIIGWPWFLLAAGLLILTALPVDLGVQATFGAVSLFVLAVLRRWRDNRFARTLSLVVMLMISLRYIFWRTFFTLDYPGLFDFIGTILLYGAEVYGFLLFLLGLVVNLSPVNRVSVPTDWDDANLPTVDVLIPSYNEDKELLSVTLVAATQIRYPKGKLSVYLLDDGGTDEKRNDRDPAKAALALARHNELQDLCRRFGAHYITRPRNLHAKAGNLNEALPKIHGDLVLVLDADHVPTADILEKTVGYFQRDPKLFLVQTPHFFINADPIEKNLNTFADMPGENEMFYRVIQKGLDYWNASFFCGSAGILRRRCLDELGGFSHETITEDAETALLLHARGYNSAYVGHPMVAGLAPETFSGFVIQRMRWAQGMVQIFMLRNPFRIPGLNIWQRLNYLSNSLFWFFPYARVIYLLAPTAYLFFGLKIYHASAAQFLAYTLPHFIASMYATSVLFGKVRWPFISAIYEVMQSLFSLGAVTLAIRNPHAPSFKVTPKREQLDRDYISPLAGPFYFIFLILTAAMAAGFYRIYFGNPLDIPVDIVTMLWNLFNYLIILASLGALYERRQRRQAPRMPANLPADLTLLDGTVIPGRVIDLSVGGAAFISRQKIPPIPRDASLRLRVQNKSLGRPSDLKVMARSRGRSLGLAFAIEDDEALKEVVSLVHGDSERWKSFWDSRLKPVGVLRSLVILVLRGMVNFGRYLAQTTRYLIREAPFIARHLQALPAQAPKAASRVGRSGARRIAPLWHLVALYVIGKDMPVSPRKE